MELGRLQRQGRQRTCQHFGASRVATQPSEEMPPPVTGTVTAAELAGPRRAARQSGLRIAGAVYAARPSAANRHVAHSPVPAPLHEPRAGPCRSHRTTAKIKQHRREARRIRRRGSAEEGFPSQTMSYARDAGEEGRHADFSRRGMEEGEDDDDDGRLPTCLLAGGGET